MCPDSEDCETRCDSCPTTRLEEFLQGDQGALLKHVLDLDFALKKGFAITLDEINMLEFSWLRVLDHERSEYEAEQIERDRNHSPMAVKPYGR